ncbi:MAG: TIGR02996 domain-containing protein [Gemmataceae bacterium]
MDVEQAVLQAIQTDPADETNWLVLADWLEEKGEPERAYVRLHRRLRGLPEGAEREHWRSRRAPC